MVKLSHRRNVMNAVITFASAIAFAVPLVASAVVHAAEFPARSITLIVPYPAGGGVDAMARVVAQKLSDAFRQTVTVDNRGGGGGTIGTRAVARAAPDGYTLLLGHTGTLSINPSLYTKLGMDPRKDFAPIGLVASMPVALLAHPSFSAKTVADVIALAKKEPGKLNIGTSPVGTGGYMCAELFKAEAGIDAAIIPYKGTAPVMNDLLGGHVPVAFGVLPPALGNIAAGQLRAIAVTSKQRFSLLPDVPTFDESGMPGFEAVLHYGLLAPSGTPPEIVEILSAELRKLGSDPEVQKRIRIEGGDPLASTPAEYADDIDKEEKKWSKLVHQLGLKVE
ncbi:tripartite tricarboxylate transporter substrate binding protein [Bradyrhizobium sp. AUGA SZCCT0182]|uniref:Bug family tripartite tricarboxylate transporter substrate binding protein n=1 Tax=Bradyrhizobium sp. AUGA SZCCT0182 TaxID=2807667 RepID=UPI001BA6CAC1|nr:tripartite tricarboxylate transporter substrate binding protein [Bradyrhizobium sp. AUGA SZCCT0182]MBR1232491.1 tripartite tricarboxylate transporter substrate binding protein [Bradyrhizobium sp. AUGA SZCCT0182]